MWEYQNSSDRITPNETLDWSELPRIEYWSDPNYPKSIFTWLRVVSERYTVCHGSSFIRRNIFRSHRKNFGLSNGVICFHMIMSKKIVMGWGKIFHTFLLEWSELPVLDCMTDPNYPKWGNSDQLVMTVAIFADTFF